MATRTKNYISVPKAEYLRLKKVDKRFRDFLSYAEHLQDIREAREKVKQGKTISQEELFRRLGL